MYPEAMKATFQIENPTYHSKVRPALYLRSIISFLLVCCVIVIYCVVYIFQKATLLPHRRDGKFQEGGLKERERERERERKRKKNV